MGLHLAPDFIAPPGNNSASNSLGSAHFNLLKVFIH
jgi:hypothetical protein